MGLNEKYATLYDAIRIVLSNVGSDKKGIKKLVSTLKVSISLRFTSITHSQR